jgi:hypothetical protein
MLNDASDIQPAEIYREAWYGNRPKSVALRREGDYHTGLSFSTQQPDERPYLVYLVARLEEAGFAVEFNGGKVVVSKWDTDWKALDAKGRVRHYSKYHASIYRDQDYWKRWYDAEKIEGGNGSTGQSQALFDLAEEYRED